VDVRAMIGVTPPTAAHTPLRSGSGRRPSPSRATTLASLATSTAQAKAVNPRRSPRSSARSSPPTSEPPTSEPPTPEPTLAGRPAAASIGSRRGQPAEGRLLVATQSAHGRPRRFHRGV
jgi:hypothetical protein